MSEMKFKRKDDYHCQPSDKLNDPKPVQNNPKHTGLFCKLTMMGRQFHLSLRF